MKLTKPLSLSCAFIAIAALLVQSSILRAQEPLRERIPKFSVLYRPLLPVGPTSQSEDESLWEKIERRRARNGTAEIFEEFITTYPDSAWVPSVRANLGRHYEERGLLSRSFEQWSAAWELTGKAERGPAKEIADYVFVHWCKMLVIMGRMDELGDLLRKNRERLIADRHLKGVHAQTVFGYQAMLASTESGFRCGVFALNAVGASLKPGKHDPRAITSLAAPTTGFSLAALGQLARRVNLDLVATHWVGTKQPIVPSVVHWRANHYAAITQVKDGKYKIVDPGLIYPRWMSEADIQEEASGNFLIPRERLDVGWEELSNAEASRVFGRGYFGGITDGEDGCANGSGGGPGGRGGGGGGGGGGRGRDKVDSASSGVASSPPCAGNCTLTPGGVGGGKSCPPCKAGSSGNGNNHPKPGENGYYVTPLAGGMPYWDVSEPYINVWLYDEPLAYQTSFGERINLTLAYNQRNQREVNPNFFNFGDKWECDWLSYVLMDGENFEMALPRGGSRNYEFFEQDGVTQVELLSDTKAEEMLDQNNNATNYVIRYSDGSADHYDYCPVSTLEDKHPFFLTRKVDPQGRTVLALQYQEISQQYVRLLYVIDGDGRTNRVLYGDSLNPTLVTAVVDPFGNTNVFRYDETRMLTNIVDAVGLSSGFIYDEQGWLTNLVTPYGITRFEHFAQDFNPDIFAPVRVVRAIDPLGGTNVFMLRQSCQYLNSSSMEPFIPDYYEGTENLIWVPNQTFDAYRFMFARNTFHWGPRQAVALPTNYDAYSVSDYLKARMMHWLHRNGGDLSHILSMSQEPSPDGVTRGQSTWYDYEGKGYEERVQGTQSKPKLIAQILPDGTTWYQWFQRDEWGRTTNSVETSSSVFRETPQTRTNRYVYGENGIDLIATYGPDDQLEAGYAYDSAHRLIRSTNALQEVTHFFYDSAGRFNGMKTPAELTTTNVFYASGEYAGWLEYTAELEILRTNRYTYLNNRVREHIDERGLATTNTWDALGRLRRVDYPGGYVTNHYTNLDLVKTTDRMGFSTYYKYDSLRRVTAITNALGFFTLYNHCSCGGLDSVRDAEGNYESYTYDNGGRVSSKIHRDGSVTSYHYNLLGQLTNVMETGGYNLTNWYNNQGLLYASSNSFGLYKYVRFDIEDRPFAVTDANGVTITNSYDALGRVLTRQYPDSGIEAFKYSRKGLIAYTNQLTNVTFYAYDTARRKTAETNANLEVTRFFYTPAGDLEQLIDGNTNSTYWHYDMFGRVTNKVDNLGTNLFFYSYDLNGRLTNRTSAAKGTTAYAYDAVGSLTNIVYPHGPSISMSYDALNRLTNMVDGIGATRYGYNSLGQVALEDGPWSDDAVNYTYANRLRSGLSAQVPNSSLWTADYAYDEARRLTGISSPAGTFDYDYVPGRQGLVRALELPSGAAVTNNFDTVGRLTGTWLIDGDGEAINRHTYLYNQAGQRTNHTRVKGDYATYAYDKIGQLTYALGREVGGSTSRMNERFRYGYDAAGNLKARTNTSLVQFFNVDSLNQLTNVNRLGNTAMYVSGTVSTGATSVTIGVFQATRYADGTWSVYQDAPANGTNNYTAIAEDAYGRKDTNSVSVYLPLSVGFGYDLNGNLLSDGRRAFDYDDENQLIRVTITNATKSEFRYDGKMRRRERIEAVWSGGGWVTNLLVRYVYDGNLVLQERHFNPQLSTDVPQRVISYTRGLDLSGSLEGAGGIGGMLARSDHSALSAQPVSAYYHADGNGNITCMVDEQNRAVARYIYDPFGNLASSQGPLAEDNLYRFSSKEFHPPSGLVYYLYRYYEPNLQRWANRDPLGVSTVGPAILENDFLIMPWESFTEYNGANLHGFCGNNPLDHFDAEGLCKKFVSQWPGKLQEQGDKINGKPYPKLPGKATALGALRTCKDNCVAMYGAAAEADDDCPSCKKMCDADCNANFDKAIGKKTKK